MLGIVVTAGIAAAGKIVDRLIELAKYREEKSRRVFDKLIEPTFNDLLVVHKDYLEMFDRVLELLPQGDKSNTKQARLKLKAALTYLHKQRQQFQEERKKLRDLVNELKGKHSQSPNAAFVQCVADYLVWTNQPNRVGTLSTIVESKIREQLGTATDKPLTGEEEGKRYLMTLTQRTDYPVESAALREYISDIISSLRQRFALASEVYARILVEQRTK